MEQTVEAYREKFKAAPLGRWNTAVGSFNNVMDVVWEFYPDGTGQYQELGPFGYPAAEAVLFEWKGCQELTMWFRELNGEEEPDPWFQVRYDFKAVTHDMGQEIAMIEMDENGGPRVGFGWSINFLFEEPLSYLGSADPE